MINELIKLATHLDKKGLRKEADYIDAVIKKEAFGKVKLSQSYCQGYTDRAEGATHKVSYLTMDKSSWDKELYKKAFEAFGKSKAISKDNISFELIHLICSRLHQHVPKDAWLTLPPHVEGSQNRPSSIGFNVTNGQVIYDAGVNGGLVNAHTGFDWSTFDPAPFQTAVQKQINNLASILKDPRFKFEVVIVHGM